MSDAFSKMKSTFGRSVTTINVKTTSTLEKIKLNTQIETLVSDVKVLYTESGELLYNNWVQGIETDPKLTDKLACIKEKLEQIENLNVLINSIDDRDSEILGAKQQVQKSGCVCSKCNAEYSVPVKFCKSCGTQM